MSKTSPKLRKAAARSSRERVREELEALGSDRLEDDFRTEAVPGPGPRDAGVGRATTKQLETHELKHPPR